MTPSQACRLLVPGPSPGHAWLTSLSGALGKEDCQAFHSPLCFWKVTSPRFLRGPFPLHHPITSPSANSWWSCPLPLESSDTFLGDSGEPLPCHRASRVPHKKWTNVPKHDSCDTLLPGCTTSSCLLPQPESCFQRLRGRRSFASRAGPAAGVLCR